MEKSPKSAQNELYYLQDGMLKRKRLVVLQKKANHFNFYLKTFEQKVYDTYHELMRDKESVTCESLKNKLLGKGESTRMLIPIFEDHNNRMESLLIRIAKGT
jgi:hypothetical protein